MENFSVDKKDKNSPLLKAEDAKSEADKDMKTCCFLCKYKPDYLAATPKYERAASNYNLARKFADEIICREQLVICYRSEKDTWSEGNTFEKMANILLFNLDENDRAYDSIINASLAYKAKGDYKYTINCLAKISKKFIEKNDKETALKCLNLAHNEVMICAHVVSMVRDTDYTFVYNAETDYTILLALMENFDECIKVSREFINAIFPTEEQKFRLIKYYGLIAICHLLKENYNEVEKVFEEVKEIGNKGTDISTMDNIKEMWFMIKAFNPERFLIMLKVVTVDYDINITKQLNHFFKFYCDKYQNKISDKIDEKDDDKVHFSDINLKIKPEEKNEKFADDLL